MKLGLVICSLALAVLLTKVEGNPFKIRSSGTEGQVRLVGGQRTSTSWSGRVEIFHDGQWGTVCDDRVNDEDARITCQGLGFSQGVVNNGFQGGSGPIWMDEIDCDPPQARLSECRHAGWGVHDCTHREDFGVYCSTGSGEGGSEGEVRLVGGVRTPTSYSGRVEIYHAGEWGTVCDDGVDAEDARIVCQGLGYTQGTVNNDFPGGTGQIWMDDINCNPGHNGLADCIHRGWGTHNCGHNEDFGVVCSNPSSNPITAGTEGEVRLVGGVQTPTSLSGRVEIFHAGQWGTVCDDGVNTEDARIVCQGLGYTAGTVNNDFPGGTGQIWMDDIDCDPGHNGLADCIHRGWGTHNCGHNEDFGVECSGLITAGTEGEVRLVEGVQTPSLYSGRVEIYHAGQWGTVCDDGVNAEDARIVCQGLGYTAGTVNNDFPGGTGQIWMDDIDCDPEHNGLADCIHRGWGTHNCGHNEDFGVECRT